MKGLSCYYYLIFFPVTFVSGIGTLIVDNLTTFSVARHKLDMKIKQKK